MQFKDAGLRPAALTWPRPPIGPRRTAIYETLSRMAAALSVIDFGFPLVRQRCVPAVAEKLRAAPVLAHPVEVALTSTRLSAKQRASGAIDARKHSSGSGGSRLAHETSTFAGNPVRGR